MAIDAVMESAALNEVDFDLEAFDGKKIWCRLNKAESGNAQKAVILSHGLTGCPTEYIHMAAKDYFTERGYDVYRFSYYHDGDDYRILTDCTLEIHGKDLNSVVDYVRKKYEKLFVCGHSYGGLTMLFANPDVTAASFWDASFTPYESFWKDCAEHVPELDCYSLKWESDFKIGKAMFEEGKQTDDKAEAMAAAFRAPAQVMLAGDNAENVNRTHLFESLSGEKEMHDVEGADHCFTRGKTVFDLLEKTYNWFERY